MATSHRVDGAPRVAGAESEVHESTGGDGEGLFVWWFPYLHHIRGGLLRFQRVGRGGGRHGRCRDALALAQVDNPFNRITPEGLLGAETVVRAAEDLDVRRVPGA